MGRRTSSTLSLTNGTTSPKLEPSGSHSAPQRKRLLKAPSLAELDSSDSDVSMSLCVRDILENSARHVQSKWWWRCPFVWSTSLGWVCWAQVSQQLQRGDIFDGWHVPRVRTGEEKWVRIYFPIPVTAQTPPQENPHTDSDRLGLISRPQQHVVSWRCLKSFFLLLHLCVWTTAPPMFLPISSTPQPERRKTPQRRHSIEKETPTNVRQFLPPSKQSSKSLVSHTSFVFDTNQFIEASTGFKRLKPGRWPQWFCPCNLIRRRNRGRDGGWEDKKNIKLWPEEGGLKLNTPRYFLDYIPVLSLSPNPLCMFTLSVSHSNLRVPSLHTP